MREIQPFKHQVPIIAALIKALNDTGRALLVMATGTGKTLTAGFVLRALLKKNDRLLFLCHNADILEHAMREFRKLLGEEESFGIFTGTRKRGVENARFVFATLQTMNLRKKAFRKNAFSVVVVDEGHHAQADTFKSAITYFTPRYLLGMTATPDRLDRKDIREVFGPEIWTLTLEEAIAKGYVTPVDYRLMTIGSLKEGVLEKLLKEVKEEGKRPSIRQLNETLFVDHMDDEIAREIIKVPGTKIIFCKNTTHAKRFVDRLPSSAEFHSKLSKEENERAFTGFVSGEVQHLITVNKFNEGVDVPHTDGGVFLRETDSITIVLQQLGRTLRLAPGKKRVIILDFVGNVERIALVQNLIERINAHRECEPNERGESSPQDVLVLSGAGYNFDISSEAMNILEILQRIQSEFYTYEEAKKRVQEMGIRNGRQYRARYREDPRLPSCPDETYTFSGWISWPAFLGTGHELGFYTYEEAVKRVREMGIKSALQYRARHPENQRLPANPDQTYTLTSEWISWPVFLDKSTGHELGFYTYEEAVRCIRRMGITSHQQYNVRYREDPRLPSAPNSVYASTGWVSWPVFLGKDKPRLYAYEEAMKRVREMGITSSSQYIARYHEDPRLPARADTFYASTGWVSWAVFFGTTLYTYKEAVKRAQEMGFKTKAEYLAGYTKDPRLPSNPSRTYVSSGWVSWPIFFGTKTAQA